MNQKIKSLISKKILLIPLVIIMYFVLLTTIPKLAAVFSLFIGIVTFRNKVVTNKNFKFRHILSRVSVVTTIIMITFVFSVLGLITTVRSPEEAEADRLVIAEKENTRKQQEADKKVAEDAKKKETEEKIKAEKEAKEAAEKAEKERIAKEQAEKEAVAKAEKEKYLSQFTWYNDNFGVVLDSGSVSYGFFNGKGRLISLKNKDYSYVQIQLGLYAENGNKVGDALANTSSLAKGTTWQFEAVGTVSTKGKVKWKVESVTGF